MTCAAQTVGHTADVLKGGNGVYWKQLSIERSDRSHICLNMRNVALFHQKKKSYSLVLYKDERKLCSNLENKKRV